MLVSVAKRRSRSSPPLLGGGGFLAWDIEAGRDVAVLSRPEEEHADGLALVRQLGGVVRVDAGLGEACWLDGGVSDPVRKDPTLRRTGITARLES